MARHKCETYDWVKGDNFEYGFIKNYSGTFIDAMKEVYKEAREKAEKAGEDALKDETCHGPCERAIFVDTGIKSIDFGRREQGSFNCEIKGRWEAYILCYKEHKKAESSR